MVTLPGLLDVGVSRAAGETQLDGGGEAGAASSPLDGRALKSRSQKTRWAERQLLEGAQLGHRWTRLFPSQSRNLNVTARPCPVGLSCLARHKQSSRGPPSLTRKSPRKPRPGPTGSGSEVATVPAEGSSPGALSSPPACSPSQHFGGLPAACSVLRFYCPMELWSGVREPWPPTQPCALRDNSPTGRWPSLVCCVSPVLAGGIGHGGGWG